MPVTFDPKKKYTDHELMGLAVKIAEQSHPEDDGRIHPLVGAVIARDGFVLSTGFRGEKVGAHAEETALSKLSAAQAVGTTVYSTLEPCTTRGRTPCAHRLNAAQVAKVVIGMLDPNPDIRGQGEWLLESAGRSLGKFESTYVTQIKAHNAEFIDYMQGVGVAISSPADGSVVTDEPCEVSGTYRVHPRPGDKIVLFGRRNVTYYPQAPILWTPSNEGRTWRVPRVFLTGAEKPKPYGIVVARVSEDLAVWLNSYNKVHEQTGQWIGAEMPTPPPGFQVLASVNVTRAPGATNK